MTEGRGEPGGDGGREAGDKSMESLTRALEIYGISEPGDKVAKIRRYLDLVKARRTWAGLSSRSLPQEPTDAVLDSLGVLSVVRCDTARTVADLGSGGGLLGVVLAIACEDWAVTLVESSSRKSVVLAEVVGALGLANAVVYNGRAENLLGRHEFEVVVSRAAGPLRRLAPVAVGLLGGGGRYVALKGGGAERELEEVVPMLARLGAELVEVTAPLHEGEPGVSSRVTLVVIDKI